MSDRSTLIPEGTSVDVLSGWHRAARPAGRGALARDPCLWASTRWGGAATGPALRRQFNCFPGLDDTLTYPPCSRLRTNLSIPFGYSAGYQGPSVSPSMSGWATEMCSRRGEL